MRRRLRPEEARLWSLIAATVRPASAGRRVVCDPAAPAEAAAAPLAVPAPSSPVAAPRRADAELLARLAAEGVGARPTPSASRIPVPAGLPTIEPNRRRRIARARDPIGGRLDLHGHDQDRARAVLHAFIARAHADGDRAVLVITGKGRMGGGVLRLRVPDWLNEAPSRARVAGVSAAEARHGGEGALYVALKRG